MANIFKSDKLFYLLFFLPLTGSAFLGYAISVLFFVIYFLSRNKKEVTQFGILAFVLYVFLVIAKLIQTGNPSVVSVITRFYLGIGPILFYVYYSKVKVNINFIILLLSIEVLIEAFLINFVISPTLLPNYPTEIKLGGFDSTEVMGYQRPYSIGINATVTATILCMLLAYREAQCKAGAARDFKLDIISTLAILALASGTGILLFAIYIFYRFSGAINLKNISILILLVLIILRVVNSELLGDSLISHFSTEYFQFMIDYKEELYSEYLSSFNNKFLGVDFHNMPPLTHGDTALVEFLLSFGLFGIIYFFLLVSHYFNKINWCPLLIGLIGAFHYGGIFSLPGQMLMAYVMVLNIKSRSYYYK